MKMDWFIRTYQRDLEWLRYLMRSMKKFCSGYHEIVVVCPNVERDVIYPVVSPYDVTLVSVHNHEHKGYLEQQYHKMVADTFCSGDYIAFVDSDCIFTKPNTPETWFVDGKIMYLITPFSVLGSTAPYKELTERALGVPCEFETMRRHPCIYPREVIEGCRKRVESIHGMMLRDYILDHCGGKFSEFNVMGNYAMHFEPQKFHFVDTTKNPLPEKYLEQRWSYGGLTRTIIDENERFLS